MAVSKSRRHRAPKSSPKPRREPVGAVDDPKFVQDVVTRGDAVEPSPDGTLPKGATYAIVKKRGGAQIKHVRSSLV